MATNITSLSIIILGDSPSEVHHDAMDLVWDTFGDGYEMPEATISWDSLNSKWVARYIANEVGLNATVENLRKLDNSSDEASSVQ